MNSIKDEARAWGLQAGRSGAVAQGWKHFVGSLKAYVETGTGQPW